ncbi:MAG: hypothetical protein II030_04125, partial [Treponema sp.]|nr:hypothetical protein [Treponema sp.]
IAYINSCKDQIFPAVCENSRKDRLASTGLSNRASAMLSNHASTGLSNRASQGSVHAVTSNFLHCKCLLQDGQEIPAPGTIVNVRIKEALLESIKNGGEEECLAEIIL